MKKNTVIKLTAHFDFSLLSSLPASTQHHGGHRGNNFTYWHNLQHSQYMATTPISTKRQNHCAQHYAAAVGTHSNLKRMPTRKISADVWNTERPCRFDKSHCYSTFYFKRKTDQILRILGYLLWYLCIEHSRIAVCYVEYKLYK